MGFRETIGWFCISEDFMDCRFAGVLGGLEFGAGRGFGESILQQQSPERG